MVLAQSQQAPPAGAKSAGRGIADRRKPHLTPRPLALATGTKPFDSRPIGTMCFPNGILETIGGACRPEAHATTSTAKRLANFALDSMAKLKRRLHDLPLECMTAIEILSLVPCRHIRCQSSGAAFWEGLRRALKTLLQKERPFISRRVIEHVPRTDSPPPVTRLSGVDCSRERQRQARPTNYEGPK